MVHKASLPRLPPGADLSLSRPSYRRIRQVERCTARTTSGRSARTAQCARGSLRYPDTSVQPTPAHTGCPLTVMWPSLSANAATMASPRRYSASRSAPCLSTQLAVKLVPCLPPTYQRIADDRARMARGISATSSTTSRSRVTSATGASELTSTRHPMPVDCQVWVSNPSVAMTRTPPSSTPSAEAVTTPRGPPVRKADGRACRGHHRPGAHDDFEAVAHQRFLPSAGTLGAPTEGYGLGRRITAHRLSAIMPAG